MNPTQRPPKTRPSSHPAAPMPGRNIITVASGKGGVGKTWLSITLTHALARSGQKVLLFDGDLGLANADIQLGLMPERDLGGVITGKTTMEDARTPYPEGGFEILAGRSGSGSLGSLSREHLLALRTDLLKVARQYDRVVLDLGAGIDNVVQTLSVSAGPKLVVTTDEPTALTDAYAFIKVTSQRQKSADLRVVVNMASSKAEGERTYAKLLKACEGFLNISPPLAGIICRDEKVSDAIRNQTTLLTRHPNCHAAGEIEALAQKLIKETASGG